MARTGRLRAAVAGLVVAASLAACSSTTSPSTGSTSASKSGSTPQEAVTNLLDALNSGNWNNVIDSLAPGESRALHVPLANLLAQLDRLGILASGTSLDHISGVKLNFAGPTFSVTPVTPGVDWVTFTGGTVTATVDPASLPLGPKVTDQLPALPAAKTTTSQLAKNAGTTGLAVIEASGKWYVSLGYSIAEQDRRRAGSPLPDASQAIQPDGASTPEAAVTQLINDAVTLNVKDLLALTVPQEEAAARAYASMFLPETSGLSTLATGKVRVTLDDITYTTQKQADGTLVKIKAIKATVVADGNTFTYQNGCVAFTENGVPLSICRNNLDKYLQAGHASDAIMRISGIITTIKPDLGIVAVSDSGKWYISPVRTLIDDSTAVLASLTPDQLNTLIQEVAAAGKTVTKAAQSKV